MLLWMTNREKLHRFLHDELLSAWGLEHVATWVGAHTHTRAHTHTHTHTHTQDQ